MKSGEACTARRLKSRGPLKAGLRSHRSTRRLSTGNRELKIELAMLIDWVYKISKPTPW
jgi:hypothetical protein